MSEYVIRRLALDEKRPPFDCSDSDLNEFFAIDSIVSGSLLLAVTYVVEVEKVVVAFFSLSNDAVKKDELSRSRFERITKFIPRKKRYSTLPAVKIGRLATDVALQSSGVGSEILDYIKSWFIDGNKTGCRFIIVDAYNNDRTIKFYMKNGFSFMLTNDEKQETRLMIFDLMTIQPSL
jgi:GNAT superfamily N-acetyltransferase